MALDRSNRDMPYIAGRMIAVAERYAGDRFGSGTVNNAMSHPRYMVGVWQQYIDTADEYYKELSRITLPVTLKPIEIGQAWIGYYHQRQAYEDTLPLHEKIVAARKGAHLTQQAVADAVGLERETYARIERGTGTTVATLKRIGEYLGLRLTFESM